jgi:hypothetical protein
MGTIVGIFAIFIVFLLVLSSRMGENEGFSSLWKNWSENPRAATVDEQRELMRLTLIRVFEVSNIVAKTGQTPRIALNLLPNRLCDPVPQIRGCQPNAIGKKVLVEPLSAHKGQSDTVPVALRRALVQVRPTQNRLPAPALPNLLLLNGDAPMTPDDRRLVADLYKGKVSGGLGYASMSWAVVSADGKTAIMQTTLINRTSERYMGVGVFRHQGGLWRRTDVLRY